MAPVSSRSDPARPTWSTPRTRSRPSSPTAPPESSRTHGARSSARSSRSRRAVVGTSTQARVRSKDSMVVAVLASGLAGLLIGSFLNVVAWRLPRGESLMRPGSACPVCRAPIKPYDNIPVLSWLVLRGRCRHCGARISGRYPAVELTTAVLYIAVALGRDGALEIALGLLLVTALVPIALIDLDLRIIPNAITLPAAVAAIVAAGRIDSDLVPGHGTAGLAVDVFFQHPVRLYPRNLAKGDVKLAAVPGSYLGRAVAPAIFVALISGVLVGALVIARKGAKEGRRTAVPFGPFLALGGVVALFAGDLLVDAYLGRS